MDAGLGFRDGAVVGLDLRGLALDEDALDGFAARGDETRWVTEVSSVRR